MLRIIPLLILLVSCTGEKQPPNEVLSAANELLENQITVFEHGNLTSPDALKESLSKTNMSPEKINETIKYNLDLRDKTHKNLLSLRNATPTEKVEWAKVVITQEAKAFSNIKAETKEQELAIAKIKKLNKILHTAF